MLLEPTSRKRPVVGVVYPLQFEDVAAELVAEVDVLHAETTDDDGVAGLVDEVDGLIIRGPAKLTAPMIESSPRLRVVAVTGSGTNHVDVDAATRCGIPVAYGRGVSPQAVAEYVIGGVILARRQLLGFHQRLMSGQLVWSQRLGEVTHEVIGSRLGVAGLGAVGQAVAKIAWNGLEMEVLAYDPFAPRETEVPVTIVDDLGELAAGADVLSVNVPLTTQTRSMIGWDELRLLGPTGGLVNASRGGVVDEDAVIATLRAGELGAAVLDVFEQEPPTSARIEQLRCTPNLFVTPHIAGVTVESRHRLEQAAVRNVLDALRGVRPAALANPEVVFPEARVGA